MPELYLHEVRVINTAQLPDAARRSARQLMDAAFGGEFSDDDWAHALGGWHALAGADRALVGHASVVERRIVVGAHEFRAGYVEAVAVRPSRQRRGVGTMLMIAIAQVIQARFEIGVLATGEWAFYERLGWERWRGPTFVKATGGALQRTPDEDDGVMVLRCESSREIDLAAPIICDARAGDSW